MEFREYVGVLRARRTTVLLAIVLFMLAAAAVDLMRPTEHTAESRVLVTQADVVDSLLGISPGVSQPDRDLATHAELVRSPETAAAVIERLSLGTTPGALTARLVVEPVGGSDLLAIRATDRNPAQAARIANAFASVYVEQRAAEQRARLEEVRKGLSAQRAAIAERVGALDKQVRAGKSGAAAERDAAAASLSEVNAQIERIGTGASLDLAGARIIGTASAGRTEPSAGLASALLLGAALGFTVGVGTAFTAEHFDTRVRSAADIGAFVPVVGALPAERSGRGGASLTMLREPASHGSDAYRLLRHAVRGDGRTGGARVVCVTAAAGPGTAPSVAANLALALAHAGDRVMLIDCDLRRSPLQHLFGLQGGAGLADVLTGARQLPEVSQRPSHQRLTVVAGGTTPGAPAELLGSLRMQQVVREAASTADWVILSAPPLLETADTASVLEWAERLLVVVRARETRREQVASALDLLGRVGAAPRAEIVLVGVPEGGQGIEPYLVASAADTAAGAAGAGAGASGGTSVGAGADSLRPREALAR